MKPVVLIPIYNHGETIGGVLDEAARLDLPCLVVNDGSRQSTVDRLQALDARHDWMELLHLPANRGKGRALCRGFERARERGFSHAVVLDADGQHRVRDVPRFLAAAREHPKALILGDPEFDENIPASRLYGREFSRFWVRLETGTNDIHDPLVGFRCYPVRPTLRLLEHFSPGMRMEFEPEIAVLYQWTYGRIENVPTRVHYDPEGTSHFRYVLDNLRMSWMHIRMVLRMALGRPRRVRGKVSL